MCEKHVVQAKTRAADSASSQPAVKRPKGEEDNDEVTEKGQNLKKKNKESKMCHQCQRNDKGAVVYGQNCKSKHYCLHCIRKWYPEMTEDEFEESCPVCRRNRNCKAWLRMKVMNVMTEEKDEPSDAQKVSALRCLSVHHL